MLDNTHYNITLLITFVKLLASFYLLKYSRLRMIQTFKGNRKKFELSGVRVIKGKII